MSIIYANKCYFYCITLFYLRKTTKAQIQINYPAPKPAQIGFRTDAAHNVEAPSQVRSEVVVPVGAADLRYVLFGDLSFSYTYGLL